MKSIIRHGSTPPTSNDLDKYQLGFCNSNNLLYIKNANGEIVPLNDLQSIRNYKESSGNGGAGTVKYFATTAEANTALAITDPTAEGYIPNDAIIIIGDAEQDYLKSN